MNLHIQLCRAELNVCICCVHCRVLAYRFVSEKPVCVRHFYFCFGREIRIVNLPSGMKRKNVLLFSRTFPPQWCCLFCCCPGGSLQLFVDVKSLCTKGLQSLPSGICDIFARAEISRILIARTCAAPKYKVAFHILKTNSCRGTPGRFSVFEKHLYSNCKILCKFRNFQNLDFEVFS